MTRTTSNTRADQALLRALGPALGAQLPRQLQRTQSLRLRGPHLLRAQEGSLWVTVDGEPEDRVIEPGQWLRLHGEQPAFITALGGHASFQLLPQTQTPGAPWPHDGLWARASVGLLLALQSGLQRLAARLHRPGAAA
jgi:hypothetical protein